MSLEGDIPIAHASESNVGIPIKCSNKDDAAVVNVKEILRIISEHKALTNVLEKTQVRLSAIGRVESGYLTFETAAVEVDSGLTQTPDVSSRIRNLVAVVSTLESAEPIVSLPAASRFAEGEESAAFPTDPQPLSLPPTDPLIDPVEPRPSAAQPVTSTISGAEDPPNQPANPSSLGLLIGKGPPTLLVDKQPISWALGYRRQLSGKKRPNPQMLIEAEEVGKEIHFIDENNSRLRAEQFSDDVEKFGPGSFVSAQGCRQEVVRFAGPAAFAIQTSLSLSEPEEPHED